MPPISGRTPNEVHNQNPARGHVHHIRCDGDAGEAMRFLGCWLDSVCVSLVMKKLIALSFIVCALAVSAGTTNLHSVTFGWRWIPNTIVDLGGLSTNDYLTNISFKLYYTTNVTQPMSIWKVATNWPAAPLLSQGPLGSMWTSSVTVDGFTRFYALTAFSSVASEGESPFSNTALQLAPLPSGTLEILR